MTPITAPSPATAVPDAIVAMPDQAPVQQPATGLRPGGRDGPLRSGHPRGNPSLALASRCGARTRSGCPCQAPAVRGKLSCPAGRPPGQAPHRDKPGGRLKQGKAYRGQAPHGGRSTGPAPPKASPTCAPPARSVATTAPRRAPATASVSPRSAAPAPTWPRSAARPTCRLPSSPACMATRPS